MSRFSSRAVLLVLGLVVAACSSAPTRARQHDDDHGAWTRLTNPLPESRGQPAVRIIVVDPVDPAKVYVATLDSVYKSIDGGTTWQDASAGLFGTDNTLRMIDQLVITRSTPPTLFTMRGGRIYKSVDEAVTWVEATNGITVPFPNTPAFLVADLHNPVLLYAGIGFDLFRTADGGSTWSRAGETSPAPRGLAVDPTVPGRIFAIATSGQFRDPTKVFRSDDGGDTWTHVGGSFAGSAYDRAITISPTDSGTLYVGVGRRVFASVDEGATWTETGLGLPDSPAPTYVTKIVVHPARPSTLFVLMQPVEQSVAAIYRSTDAGATWSRFGGVEHLIVPALAVASSDPSIMYISTDQGLFRIKLAH